MRKPYLTITIDACRTWILNVALISKILLTIILALFIVIPDCVSQESRERLKEKTFDPEKFKDYTVELETQKYFEDMLQCNLSSVTFLDARANSSKFGFFRSGDGTFYRFVFPKNTVDYITERRPKFIKFMDSSGKKNVLIVLHHLWLSQVIIKANFFKSTMGGPKDYLCFCYFNADCYTKSDSGYRYIGVIDTVLSVKKWMGNTANDLTRKTIRASLSIADRKFHDVPKEAVLISEQRVKEKESTRYNYPILNSAAKKGIFLTYNDFLNNNPADVDFEIETPRSYEVIKCGSIDTSFTNKAWGYCDGKHIYKHINNNYYRMVKSQQTFELVGPRVITQLYSTGEEIFQVAVAQIFQGLIGVMGTALVLESEKAIMHELVPYQLNIKEGTLY